jgi:hypothetical protein
MNLHKKQIAIPGETPDITTPIRSFFEDPNWENVQTVVADDIGKFGVYFLAAHAQDYTDQINVSVVKTPKSPGNDFFAHSLAQIYGLPAPASILVKIERTDALIHLEALCKSSNQRTSKGTQKLKRAMQESPSDYIFVMKFANGKGLDQIDNVPEKIDLFKQKKFLKALGYAVPFDALVCNGDRFNILHPDRFSNFGNMLLEKNGRFIAIDNGINPLGELADYENTSPSFYQNILGEITKAVMSGNRDVIDALANEIAASIAMECPKLRLNKTKAEIRAELLAEAQAVTEAENKAKQLAEAHETHKSVANPENQAKILAEAQMVAQAENKAKRLAEDYEIHKDMAKIQYQAEDQKGYIRDGIIAGIHRLQEIGPDDIKDAYNHIPDDSGKTQEALDLVLTSLAIVHTYKETDTPT